MMTAKNERSPGHMLAAGGQSIGSLQWPQAPTSRGSGFSFQSRYVQGTS
jgi:hypothetical protein